MNEGSFQSQAFVALGSNLSPGEALFDTACAALSACLENPETLRRASLWRSKPVGCPPGSPDFLNSVVAFPWPWGARRLLAIARAIEDALGRRRGALNAPRTIDLDLLLVVDEQHSSAELELPHPRLHLRRFVLEPLAELAPELILSDGRTVEATRASLAVGQPGGIERLGPDGHFVR